MKRTDRPGPGMTLALVAGLILSPTPPAQATRLFVPDPPAGARPSAASATVVVDPAVARDLATKPRRIRLESLPLPGGDRASFEVAPIEVFAPGASVVEFDGRQFRPIPRPAVVVYAGSEVGSGGRDVVLSIVEGREVRMVARRDGQVLGAVEPASGPGTPSGTHAVVDPGEMPPREATPCAGDVAPPGGRAGIGRSAATPAGATWESADLVPRSAAGATASGGRPAAPLAAEVLVDVGHDLYTRVFASDPAIASRYAANVFGAVAAIYRRDMEIELRVSQIVVWTAPDPFAGESPYAQLDAYAAWSQTHREGVPRDIAHLLAGNGVQSIAYLDVLCDPDLGYGVSNIPGKLTEFPSSGFYVWDIWTVAHEIGHNFGSPHTHCYDPPLDRCYNEDFGCYDGPVVPSLGEIMSYCFFGKGIDLHFGGTVGAVIRSRARASICVGDGVFCGNGIVEPGEECDDGNPDSGDACSTSCRRTCNAVPRPARCRLPLLRGGLLPGGRSVR